MADQDISGLSIEELDARIKKLQEVKDAKLKAETDEKIAEVRALINAYGLTKEQLFDAGVAKAAKEPKGDGESKVRRPSAIYVNAQAEKGQELYLGRGDGPSWFTEDNKSKFAVLDIAEQIRLIEQYSPDSKDPIAKRKAWLAANPTETHSKG